MDQQDKSLMTTRTHATAIVFAFLSTLAAMVATVSPAHADQPADRCEAIADKTNIEVFVYPDARHAFAMPDATRPRSR